MTITERSLRLKRPWGDRSGRPQPGLSPIIRGGKEVLTPKAYGLRHTAAAALDLSPAPELLRVRIRRAHPRPSSPPDRSPMNDRTSPASARPLSSPVTAKEVVKAAEHGWLRGFLKARLEPKAYLGLHLTVGLILGAAGIWIFGAVLDALLYNATMVRWDIATAAFIHSLMTPGMLPTVP